MARWFVYGDYATISYEEVIKINHDNLAVAFDGFEKGD
jgi:hypothetical protein